MFYLEELDRERRANSVISKAGGGTATEKPLKNMV
jgi:hypothetical protein